jgi:hypothetical protein
MSVIVEELQAPEAVASPKCGAPELVISLDPIVTTGDRVAR